MALNKKIELENGVILNYHRVLSVNNITNMFTNIEIASYTSKEKRNEEARYQELQKKNWNGTITPEELEELEKGINVYIESDLIQLDYDKNINVDNAYEYLKNTDKYKDSIDV